VPAADSEGDPTSDVTAADPGDGRDARTIEVPDTVVTEPVVAEPVVAEPPDPAGDAAPPPEPNQPTGGTATPTGPGEIVVDDAVAEPQVVQVATLDWRSGVWIAAGLFAAFVLVGLLRNVPGSITRIGVGILLAFALDPLVVRLRNRLGCSRTAAVAIVGVLMASFFAVLVFVLGPPAVEQAERFSRELPETVEDLYSFPIVGSWLEERDAAQEVRDWAADLPARIDTDSITEVARGVLDGVAAALIVLVVALAVLIDGDRLILRSRAAIPTAAEPAALRVGRTFQRTLGAYFAGSLFVASLAATFILAVGLAFGVPLAPAAALWMLIVNLIPQIGGFLGGSFFVILAVTQGVETGAACLILYLIYMNFENHIIQPAIVGQAVDLSPPATMLAALVGGAAAGVPGALVATPLVGAMKSLYLELRWGRPPPTPTGGFRLPGKLRGAFRRALAR
jgi:putative heme transporter